MNVSINFDTLKEMTEFFQMMAQQRTPAPIAIPKKEEPKPAKAAGSIDTQKPAKVATPIETTKAITPIETTKATIPIETTKPEAPAPAEPDPVKAKDTPITATDLKILAAKYSRAGHRAELKELLTQYGEKSVTDLCEHQPDKMVEFYNTINSEVANA